MKKWITTQVVVLCASARLHGGSNTTVTRRQNVDGTAPVAGSERD